MFEWMAGVARGVADSLVGLPFWLELTLVIFGMLGLVGMAFVMLCAIAGLFRLWELAVDFARKCLGLPLNNWWN